MKVRYAGSGLHPRAGRLRVIAPAALVVALALAVVLSVVFTSSISQADSPPDLGTAFNLPFKLEQGRPPPARSYVGPRQVSTPVPTPVTTPTPDPPAAPTVTLMPMGPTAINISWNEPDYNVKGYQLQVSDDGSSWELLADEARLTRPGGLYTFFLHERLESNETKHYRVRANDGTRWSAWSSPKSVKTYAAYEPTLLVEAVDNHNLKVSWRRHGDPPGYSSLTGWELQIAETDPETTSGNPWTTLSDELAVGARTYNHAGLSAGETRYFRLRERTEAGPGTWSRTVHATTFQASSPAAPSLTVRADGALAILLTWTKPAEGGVPITGFDMQHSVDGEYWKEIGPASADATRFSFIVGGPGTGGGIERYFRIRAKNAQGTGYWSRVVKGVSSRGTAGGPTGLMVVDYEADWVKLTWDAPNPKVGITGYVVQRSEDVGAELWVNVGSTNAATRTLTDRRLDPDKTYHYRVAARGIGGLGEWSTDTGVTTKASPPDAPRLTARAMCRRGGSSGKYQDDHAAPCLSKPTSPERPRSAVWVELDWTEPEANGAIISHYGVERSPNGTNGWEAVPAVNFVDNDVGSGETWFYRVGVVWYQPDGKNEDPDVDHNIRWSNTVRVTTKAFVPAKSFIYGRAHSPHQIYIRWISPADDGGRPVRRYQIQVSTKGYQAQANWAHVTSRGVDRLDYSHGSLQPNTTYCYRIRAQNSVGWGHWQQNSMQCFHTPILLPDAPRLRVNASGTESLTVSWNEPPAHGLTLSGFELDITADLSNWGFGPESDFGADERTVTYTYAAIRSYLPETNPPVAYFRVRAKATTGEISDWSLPRGIGLP